MTDGVASRTWADVDPFIEAFEAAFAGDPAAALREFLPSPEHPQYAAVLRELIRVDMELRSARGHLPSWAEYGREFPEVFRDPESAQAIAFEHQRLLRQCDRADGAGGRPERPIALCDPVRSDRAAFSQVSGCAQAQPGPRDSASPTAHFPAVGDRLHGFELLQELGRGAFSRVYLARQNDLAGRLVVVKISSELFHETDHLAQLQHTHIVPVYSRHWEAGLQVICMPFFGATTLADVVDGLRSELGLPQSGQQFASTINQRRLATIRLGTIRSPSRGQPSSRLAEPEAGEERSATWSMFERLTYVEAVLWIGARLADALAHAHERGIVHGDLKPGNVLLADDGQPMLLDFNLSADAKRTTEANGVVGGTLPYMAPEQLQAMLDRRAAADARSDIYALGALLYELLGGQRPFAYTGECHDDALRVMMAERQQVPRELRRRNTAISPAVESIVLHCLTPEPERRYQSARQLGVDLDRQLAARPLRFAPDPSVWERWAKWRRRHPVLASSAVLATLGCVLFGLLAAVATWRTAQVRALEARAQFQQTLHDVREIGFLLQQPEANQERTTEGLELCRRVSGSLGLAGSTRDLPAIGVHLANTEQRELGDALGEMFLLWSRSLQGTPGAETLGTADAENLRQALQLNYRAEACYDASQVPQAVWQDRAAILARLPGRSAEATQWQERARGAPIVSARDRWLAACVALDNRHFREALAQLREVTASDPGNPRVWLAQGHCQLHLGQLADAITSYTAGAVLWPDAHWTYFDRGLVRLQQREFDLAVEDFSAALARRPQFVEARLNRALAQLERGRLRDALADLDEVLAAPVPPVRAYFIRARVRQKAGDSAGSAADLQAGLARQPDDEAAWIARGVARLPREPRAALADFEQALRVHPRSRAALENKAHVLAEYLGQTEEAVRTLDIALGEYPDYSLGRAGRGVLRARLGRRDEALEDARQALLLSGQALIQYQCAGIFAHFAAQHPEDRAEALRLLRRAFQQGFGLQYVDSDPELHGLRGDPDFQALVSAAKALQ